MRVLLENRPEERRAGRQNDLVCLQLPGATAQGAVKEVLLLPDLPEGQADVALKIIPAQTKLLIGTHSVIVSYSHPSNVVFTQSAVDSTTLTCPE